MAKLKPMVYFKADLLLAEMEKNSLEFNTLLKFGLYINK